MQYDEKKQYQWSPSWANTLAHTDINKVVEELRIIEETWGEVRADYVVESAKNPKSVLHSFFQWDDQKAAHAYRLSLANLLLRKIELRVISDGEPVGIKVYQTVKRAEPGKQDVQVVRYDKISEKHVAQIKKICASDLKGIATRLRAISGTEDVITLLEKAVELLSNNSPVKEMEITTPVAV